MSSKHWPFSGFCGQPFFRLGWTGHQDQLQHSEQAMLEVRSRGSRAGQRPAGVYFRTAGYGLYIARRASVRVRVDKGFSGILLEVAGETCSVFVVPLLQGSPQWKGEGHMGAGEETCHYAKWAYSLKGKHGILGQGETGGQDLKCILSVCWCIHPPPLVVLSLCSLGYRRGELVPLLKPYGLQPLKCLPPNALDPCCPIQALGPSPSGRVQDICDRMQCKKNWLRGLTSVVPEEASHGGVLRTESTAPWIA